MASPGNALQQAIYQRLASQLTTPVYDHVPQNAAPPYVVIGADTLIEWGTKTRDGWEATVTVHAWDFEKAGRKSVKTILSNLYDALHGQSLTVAGFSLIDLRFEFEETYQENAEGASDHYYHGVQRYRAAVEA